MGPGARRATSLGALVAVCLAVGAGAFLAARDEPAPAAPPTTAPAPTSPSRDAVVAAVADELARSIPAAVTDGEARCLADRLVDVVPMPVLEALAERDEPLTGVAPADRQVLVRAVVDCLPDAAAAAVLGRATTTTAVAGLPDEG